MPEPNPIQTEIKIAQCVRCSGYVLHSTADGVKASADPAPASRDQYISALVAGRRVFDLLELSGRPWKLQTRTKASPAPEWAPDGSQGRSGPFQRQILVEHGCGAHAMDAARVEEVPQGPPSAPVTPGKHRGGPHPPPAPASPQEPSSPPPGTRPQPAAPPHAEPARPRLSEVRRPKCGTCRRLIADGEPFTGVHHGTWQWAEHEECP